MPTNPSYDAESSGDATSDAAETEARNLVAELYSLPELLKSLELTDKQRHDRMLAFALTASKEATVFERQVAEMPIANRPNLYAHFASQLKTYFDETLPNVMPDMDEQVTINFDDASLQMSKIMRTASSEDTEESFAIGSAEPLKTFCKTLQSAMDTCLGRTNDFDVEMKDVLSDEASVQNHSSPHSYNSENREDFTASSSTAATGAVPTYVKNLFIKLKALEDSSNSLSLSDEERNRQLNTLAWAVHSVTTAFESDMAGIEALPFTWMDHLLTELKATFARLSEIPDIDGETEMLFNTASRQMANLVTRFDGGYISEGAIATAPHLNELMDALCWSVQSAVATFLGNHDELDVVMADAEADIKTSGSRSQDSTNRGAGYLGKGIPLRKEIQKLLTRGIPSKNIKPCKSAREVLSALEISGKPLWEEGQQGPGKRNQQKTGLITATNTDIDAFVGERELMDVFKDFDSFVEFRNDVARKKNKFKRFAWTSIGLAFYKPPLIAWAKKHISPPPTKKDLEFLFEFAIFLAGKKHNFENMTRQEFCIALLEMITTPPYDTALELSGALTTLRQKILPYGLFEELSLADERFTKDTSNSQVYRTVVLKIEAYLMAKPLSCAEYVSAPEDYKTEITQWWRSSFMRNPKGALHSNIQMAITNLTRLAKTFDKNSAPPLPPPFNDWRNESEDIDVDMESSEEEVEEEVLDEAPVNKPNVHPKAEDYVTEDPAILIKPEVQNKIKEWFYSGEPINLGLLAGEARAHAISSRSLFPPLSNIFDQNKEKFDAPVTLATFVDLEEKMWALPDMPKGITTDERKDRVRITKTLNKLLDHAFDIPLVNFIRNEMPGGPDKDAAIEVAFDLSRKLAKAGVHFNDAHQCQEQIFSFLVNPKGYRYDFYVNKLVELRKILFPHALDELFSKMPRTANAKDNGEGSEKRNVRNAAVFATALWASSPPILWDDYKKDPDAYAGQLKQFLPPHYQTSVFDIPVNRINTWCAGRNIKKLSERGALAAANRKRNKQMLEVGRQLAPAEASDTRATSASSSTAEQREPDFDRMDLDSEGSGNRDDAGFRRPGRYRAVAGNVDSNEAKLTKRSLPDRSDDILEDNRASKKRRLDKGKGPAKQSDAGDARDTFLPDADDLDTEIEDEETAPSISDERAAEVAKALLKAMKVEPALAGKLKTNSKLEPSLRRLCLFLAKKGVVSLDDLKTPDNRKNCAKKIIAFEKDLPAEATQFDKAAATDLWLALHEHQWDILIRNTLKDRKGGSARSKIRECTKIARQLAAWGTPEAEYKSYTVGSKLEKLEKAIQPTDKRAFRGAIAEIKLMPDNAGYVVAGRSTKVEESPGEALLALMKKDEALAPVLTVGNQGDMAFLHLCEFLARKGIKSPDALKTEKNRKACAELAIAYWESLGGQNEAEDNLRKSVVVAFWQALHEHEWNKKLPRHINQTKRRTFTRPYHTKKSTDALEKRHLANCSIIAMQFAAWGIKEADFYSSLRSKQQDLIEAFPSEVRGLEKTISLLQANMSSEMKFVVASAQRQKENDHDMGMLAEGVGDSNAVSRKSVDASLPVTTGHDRWASGITEAQGSPDPASYPESALFTRSERDPTNPFKERHVVMTRQPDGKEIVVNASERSTLRANQGQDRLFPWTCKENTSHVEERYRSDKPGEEHLVHDDVEIISAHIEGDDLDLLRDYYAFAHFNISLEEGYDVLNEQQKQEVKEWIEALEANALAHVHAMRQGRPLYEETVEVAPVTAEDAAHHEVHVMTEEKMDGVKVKADQAGREPTLMRNQFVGPFSGAVRKQREIDQNKALHQLDQTYMVEVEDSEAVEGKEPELQVMDGQNKMASINTAVKFNPQTGGLEYDRDRLNAFLVGVHIKMKDKHGVPHKRKLAFVAGDNDLQAGRPVLLGYGDTYSKYLNRHYLDKYTARYKDRVGEWMRTFRDELKRLRDAGEPPAEQRYGTFIPWMVAAENRRKPGLNAEVFDSIDALQRRLAASAGETTLRGLLNVGKDDTHRVAFNLHRDANGAVHMQVLEPSVRTHYLSDIEAKLCPDAADRITHFPLRTQKSDYGCSVFSLSALLKMGVMDGGRWRLKPQFEPTNAPATVQKIHVVENCSRVLGPDFIKHMNDPAVLEKLAEDDPALEPVLDRLTTKKLIDKDRLAHAETRRIASTSIEEKAIVFMDRAIEEHNLSQQLREKALRKEASLVEQAQAIRAAHKNTGVALDAIIRYQQTTEGWSAERVRRVTNLAKSTDDALTEHAAGLRNALDDGMVLPPTPAVDLSHLTETIPAERPAEAAPPRPQRWRNWEAVQKAYNALKDAGSFATEDHRYTRFAQCVDAFIGYARKNGLSANLAPQALSHAIHEWLNTKGQDFKDDNPRPSLALNNLAKVCHPDYRFKTHLGIAEKVLTAAQQTEIDKTERRYQQECQQLGLPSEGYRKHIKTVYRVMLESLEAKQSPFETLQQMQKDKGSAGMKALKDTLLDSLENNATFDSQQPTSKDELRQVMHHMINLHTFGAIDEGSPRGGAGGSQTSRHPAPTIRTKASGGGKAR